MRIDINEFQISEQQKRDMKYFNEFINGNHEDKVPLTLYARGQTQKGENLYISKLKDEQQKLKRIIINNIIDKDNFISEQFSEELKESIRQEIATEVTEFDDKKNGKAHYKINIVEVIFSKSEQTMSRVEFVTCLIGIMQDVDEFNKLFLMYKDNTVLQDFIVSSRSLQNKEAINKIEQKLEEEDNEDENEEDFANENGELRYQETEEEEPIAVS